VISYERLRRVSASSLSLFSDGGLLIYPHNEGVPMMTPETSYKRVSLSRDGAGAPIYTAPHFSSKIILTLNIDIDYWLFHHKPEDALERITKIITDVQSFENDAPGFISYLSGARTNYLDFQRVFKISLEER